VLAAGLFRGSEAGEPDMCPTDRVRFRDTLIESESCTELGACVVMVRASEIDVAETLDAVGFSEQLASASIESQCFLVSSACVFVVGALEIAEAIDAVGFSEQVAGAPVES
jgi:hypothetical protein